jgi:UDP-GlcNAc:undecaprenyl-phosphate GlcNAc-1-phosphate transferase
VISSPWVAFALPFLVSLGGTALLIRLAPRLRLIDLPAERKVHTRPTPKGGGLAIFAAVALGRVVSQEMPHTGEFLLLGALLVVVGLADDLEPKPWQVRLFVHFVAAIAATLVFAPQLDELSLAAGGFKAAVMAFWIVAMINAFNMLDNMDALSAGVAWIAAGWLALAAGAGGAIPHLILMWALLGFLCFNRPPARIFMGDAGSTFLGFTMGLETARIGVTVAGPPWAWAVPLAILAVPCYDMVSVIFLRLKQGRSPFHADKQHLSHRLVERGLSKPAAVGVIYLLALASGAAGLALLRVNDPMVAALVGGSLAVWWIAFAVVEWLSVRVQGAAATSPRQAGGYINPEPASSLPPKESSHEPPT